MHKSKFTIPGIVALVLLSSMATCNAQEISESDELNQFMALLEQQTTLATQTRLNADFVPGMLSVLSAEQMQRRGFRTLWQALASLPGVIATRNETGMRSLTVRGVGNLFDTGKIKLLLNGKALNASATATTGTLYDTPIEQVARVELIRGPGSAIHGEFAFAGVLNVITHKQGEQYSAAIDSTEGSQFTALYSFGNPDSDFRTSLNVGASRQPGDDIDSGTDRSPPTTRSLAPGPINNQRDFASAIVNVESGSITAVLQLQQGSRGDYFGSNNLLPPDDKRTVITDTVVSAGLTQEFTLNEQLTGNWSLNYLHNETEQDELFLGVAEAFGGLGNEDDIIADSQVKEERIELKTRLQYDAGQHDLLIELQLTEIDINESSRSINLDPITNLPSATVNDFPGPVNESQDRSSVGLVLQDEYRYDEDVTLTTGLRFDDYEDIGSNLSPRIALVWRRSEQHIFKGQLARAFRPPSLLETGGSQSASIDPEINDTLELGHIYNSDGTVLRNTMYFVRLNDMIVFDDGPPPGFRNTDTSRMRGYEVELEQALSPDWNLVASLSLQDDIDDDLPGTAPWLLKFGTHYSLQPLTSLHLQLNSIGSRDREDGDTRGRFEQTTQVDVSMLMQNFLGTDGLDFRWGISNLLDETLKHPSAIDTYPEDYPFSEGATLWAQLVYQP